MTPNQTPTALKVDTRLDLFKSELRQNLNNMPEFKTYIAQLEREIQVKAQNLNSEMVSPQKGRGGNSMAENVKKTFLSLLPKFVTPSLFARFKEECVKKYDLRSQKQNIFVFFLFLKHLCLLGEVEQSVLGQLKTAIDQKINKYILNSRSKMAMEPGRTEFHQKNIAEFQKFLALRVDFEEGSTFRELVQQLSILFLRKKVSCKQAENKLRSVIRDLPTLGHFFSDFEVSEGESTPSSAESVKVEEESRVKKEEAMVKEEE